MVSGEWEHGARGGRKEGWDPGVWPHINACTTCSSRQHFLLFAALCEVWASRIGPRNQAVGPWTNISPCPCP